jgi:hypothetical protein
MQNLYKRKVYKIVKKKKKTRQLSVTSYVCMPNTTSTHLGDILAEESMALELLALNPHF